MKRKSKTRSAVKEPGALSRWWSNLDITARHKTILGVVQAVCLLALVGGALWGVLTLKTFVLTQPEYTPATALARLELADKPEWMTDSLSEDIRTELMGGSDAAGWVFDANLVRRVGQAATACPWVKSLQNVQIERDAPAPGEASCAAGRIVVHAQYRRPVATVQGAREQYVDAQGVLLPGEQVAKLSIKEPLPQIVNQAAPCPRVGQVWPGPDIQAALTVLRMLETKPYFHEITAVDVDCRRGSWSGGHPIVLFAGSDQVLTRIYFGGLPVGDMDRVPGQPSTTRKIGYLDGWYKQNGRRLAGPEQLDLTFEFSPQVNPRDYVPGSPLAVAPS